MTRLWMCFSILLLAISTARGDFLYVANGAGTTLGKYTTAGETINASLITGLNHPSDCVLEGGDLFIVNNNSRTIGRYTTYGATLNASLFTTPFNPWGIASDGAGHLFVTSGSNSSSFRVAEYTTGGALVNPSLITTSTRQLGIAYDGANVYVAEPLAGRIGKYTRSGATVNVSFISGLSYPVSIAYDGNGSLFVADQVRGVYQYSTTGQLLGSHLTPGFSVDTCSIGLDGRGNLYVGGPPASYTVPVGKYTTSGVAIDPALLTGFLEPTGLEVEQIPEPGSATILTIGGIWLVLKRNFGKGGHPTFCNSGRDSIPPGLNPHRWIAPNSAMLP